MKKILPLLLLMGCTAETVVPPEDCDCEKVIYIEEKYQDSSDNSWYINRIEVDRIPVECQDETDFAPTGEILECFRIECNL